MEEKWQVVSAALAFVADNVLGTSSRRQPNWFSDSHCRVQPFFNNRNRV